MKCLLIYNDKSGKGKFSDEIPNIKNILESKGHTLECILPISKEDTFTKTKDFSSDYDCYLVAGGDGTLNTVVNGIMSSRNRPKILVIPRGTTNDMAGILGITKDINQNLDLLDNNPTGVDIGKANDQYFCYAIACGAFTSVSYEAKRKNVNKHGYFAYIKQCMKKVGRNKKTFFKVTHDIGVVQGEYCLLMLLNSKRVARFNLRLFSDAKMDDGILELRLLSGMGPLNTLKVVFFFLLSGRMFRHDKQIISSSFDVETSKDMVWNVDGEKGPTGSISIEVCRKEIEFYVSESSKKKYFLKDKI